MHVAARVIVSSFSLLVPRTQTYGGVVQVEAELKELDAEEAAEYLESLGASEGGLNSLIAATYRQLVRAQAQAQKTCATVHAVSC